ncbi:MAG TPA: alpha/beta fold hydrolase [Ramlibacter sp.]|nr:alpha/beta fold hydrolase [Ramlibacter sp.]
MVDDFDLGPLQLQSGLRTGGLRLRYEMHGALNHDRSNAILFPTWFAGRHAANRWIIGSGRALDTDRFCVVVVNALGNGESSSPSNDPQLLRQNGPAAISLYDNVRAQQRLAGHLGIDRFEAIVGRSMGAQQALQWACLYPNRVGRVFAFCGVPRTTPHNRLLLEGMAEALSTPDVAAETRLARAARIYGAWCLSQEFFSRCTDATPEQWIDRHLVPNFQAFDPLDLLTLVRTWQMADISANPVFRGDLRNALHAIQARTLMLAISHDLIFPPHDIETASHCLRNGESALLVSNWGHRAAAPGGAPHDIAALEATLKRFLGTCRPSWQERLSLWGANLSPV